ncbi:hypothetical protein P154DRAFT_440141 [Amniculicola lignicola CBS 123094]|uniref:G domain-containing protein n=1 Tax=Amniculicola lignicola CBS 123094 TaxID=1392246 RepID=A0A6A5W8E7_9PLEO|nr:hypothetical protein P154DRAFT_440141 [Amniculicola lignicola CBS 123094]
MSSSSSTSRVIFTPSSAPSLGVEEDQDPDVPLPSVERDFESVSASAGQSTPGSTIFTPAVSSYTSTTDRRSEDDSLNQQLGNIRLVSRTPRSESQEPTLSNQYAGTSRSSSAPSIHVTPTASSRRTDSLVRGIGSMAVHDISASPIPAQRDRHLGASPLPLSLDRTEVFRSPSPSSRRRSGASPARTIHSVEHEEPPHALRHAQEVQQALTNARNAVAQITNILSASNLHQENNSSIGRLHRQAIALQNFQPPSSRIVGLVGDSGVGKSSLINSLLDRVDFARASNSGSACTCVVTEYHHHDGDNFIVEVNYFTMEDLKTQFSDLLEALREQNSSDGSSMTQGEVEDLEHRAHLAKDTFRAAFEHIPNYDLEELLSMPFQVALRTLLNWGSGILRRHGTNGQSAQMRETFGNIHDCSSRMRRLTSDIESSNEACLWPFIQKIRVYLKAHILSRGLIIADLPAGIRDLNTARQNITERYVRECHQIFVVTRIGRAGSDESVKEVFRLGQRASLANIGIICTQSDVIRANEARDDTANESSRARIVSMEQDVQNAQQNLDSLRNQIAEFGDDTLDLDEDESAELHHLERERSRVEYVTAKFSLHRFIVTLRNRTVTDKLEHDYSNHFAGRTSNVFCVSNTTYWQYRERTADLSSQALVLSGILDLRRHCIGIVAESHIRSVAEYINDSTPAFLDSVDLWVQAGSGGSSAERKQQILDAWHHGSYAAFCVNYGDHSTAKIGWRCWNEEAISSMSTNMTVQWASFVDDIETHIDRIDVNIEETFDHAITRLLNAGEQGRLTAGGRARHPLLTLIAAMRHRRDLLLHSLEDVGLDFQSKISALRTDAFSPIRTSIIGQIMEPAYNAARRDLGTGSWARRKTIITNGFSSHTLFSEHLQRLRNKLVAIARELQDKVNEVITQQLVFIEADLNTLRDENVVLESERNPELRRRLGAGVERGRQEMEQTQTSIQRVLDVLRAGVPTVSH